MLIFPAAGDQAGAPADIQLLGRQWSDPQLLGYADAFEQVATPAGHGYVTLGGNNTGGEPALPTTAPTLTYVPGSKPATPDEPAAPTAPITSPGTTAITLATSPASSTQPKAAPRYSVAIAKPHGKLKRTKTIKVTLRCST